MEENRGDRSETQSLQTIAELMKDIPKYATRAMKREFYSTWQTALKADKAVLRLLYRDTYGDASASCDLVTEELDQRVVDFVYHSDDPDFIYDLRKLNGNPGSTKFTAFWDATHAYFNEKEKAVQERRHGDSLYLPHAISIRELRETVAQRLHVNNPDALVPSESWIRLQFQPENPYANTAIRHTGQFDVKFQVQRRQMRSQTVDSKYAVVQFRLVKEFCVFHGQDCQLICMDDKAVIPVGEPWGPVSTGVRPHHAVLAPASARRLEALDHDWHLSGLIASVALMTDTLETINDSFYRGEIHVTVKERIFQPSSPFRHMAELQKLLREGGACDEHGHYKKPLLALYTDGGPDHRPTYLSVQVITNKSLLN